MADDGYLDALQRWQPEWMDNVEDVEQFIMAELQERQDETDSEPENYDITNVEEVDLNYFLKPDHQHAVQLQLTQSERNFSEVLKEENSVYETLTNGTDGIEEWYDFVRFVKYYRRELLWKGYDTVEKSYLCYQAYRKHQATAPRKGAFWAPPDIRTLTHQVVERMAFPSPDQEITKEFKAYVYYSLMESENSGGIYAMLHLEESKGAGLQKFLEYAKYYQLWQLEWGIMVECYVNAVTTEYKEGFKPYEPNHKPPIILKRKTSYDDLQIQSYVQQQKCRDHWMMVNREKGLEYLRARRHHEHDRRHNPEMEEFNLAPPAGMERLSRSQMEYNVFNEEKYMNEVESTLFFGDTPEVDYDYLEMLGESGDLGRLVDKRVNRGPAATKNTGIIPKMEILYPESLIDEKVVRHNQRRQERILNMPYATPWPRTDHKQPDQILVTEPFGRDDGLYLTRSRSALIGPAREGAIVSQNSDDALANIRTLSLAELIENTDHNTEMERRIVFLNMDENIKYNKKLISIFEDVIDHIGPYTVAPPTQYDFVAAEQYLSNTKLECNKLSKLAEMRQNNHDRKDLFQYFTVVSKYINNNAREITLESRSTIEDLRRFISAVRDNDKDMVEYWFGDVVGPSCNQYIQDLNNNHLHIENLIKSVDKLRVYQSLMRYKEAENQTLFDDDVYHEIQKYTRDIEELKYKIKEKERQVQISKKSNKLVKEKGQDIASSTKHYEETAASLENYIDGVKQNLSFEQSNITKLDKQIMELVYEAIENDKSLTNKGITCETKKEDLELVNESKEMLEVTNAKLLSDLTSLEYEIKHQERVVKKKSAKIKVKTEDIKYIESSVKVYEKQKAAKEVYITKIVHEKAAQKEKLAEQLAKKVRVKTGATLKYYKDIYEKDEAVFKTPNQVQHISTQYYTLMDQYEAKIAQLSSNLEEYKELKETRDQLDTVCICAVKETQNWSRLTAAQKKKYKEMSKKSAQDLESLRSEMKKKDELGKLLAEAEKRAAENEKFRVFAEETISNAKIAKTSPTQNELKTLIANVKDLTIKNQKRQIQIKKARQQMKKRANNFKNFLRALN